MKSTGIVRRMDDLGRVVLPMELRRTLNIAEKDSLEIYVDGNDIVLRKHNPGCFLCNNASNLLNVDGTLLCRECAEKIARAAE